jgi:hypothetical protein
MVYWIASIYVLYAECSLFGCRAQHDGRRKLGSFCPYWENSFAGPVAEPIVTCPYVRDVMK